jgi:hypothetical protein
MSVSKGISSFSIYPENGFLGDVFNSDDRIDIEILSLEAIKRDNHYQQLLVNESNR